MNDERQNGVKLSVLLTKNIILRRFCYFYEYLVYPNSEWAVLVWVVRACVVFKQPFMIQSVNCFIDSFKKIVLSKFKAAIHQVVKLAKELTL